MTAVNPYSGPSTLKELVAERAAWKQAGQVVVFTNGCFDLLHAGHIDLLKKARSFGDILVIGLNVDASIQDAKGEDRPILPFEERAEILSAFACVDRVVGFAEETPEALINALVPDVLVKGSDWQLDAIVGRETVESAGGRVERVELLSGRSTSEIIRRIREESSAS